MMFLFFTTEYIQKISMSILKHKPDVVITEKGLSDLCQHYLVKAGVSAIRRIRKTDNNRIAKVCGATICNRVEEITESDIGTMAGKFEVRKIGDEYFTFVEECKAPKACTILLRGASKDVLNEIERNLQVSCSFLVCLIVVFFFFLTFFSKGCHANSTQRLDGTFVVARWWCR